MNMILKRSLAAGALAFAGAMAYSATWVGECLDPENDQPYTPDASSFGPAPTQLMGALIGVSGTVTYGGEAGPCFAPARDLDFAGRFCFGVPGGGSVQSSFDDGMALTMGWDNDAAGDFTYAFIVGEDGDPANGELFGEAGIGTFVGASKRYVRVNTVPANFENLQVELELKILADTARMRWRFFNTSADVSSSYGLVFVCAPWMFSDQPDTSGALQANEVLLTAGGGAPTRTSMEKVFFNPGGYTAFNTFPDGRPIRTEKKRDRNDPDFPAYLQTLFSQTEAYGLKFDTGPTESSPDGSLAELIKIGTYDNTGRDNTPQTNLYFDPTGTVDDNDYLLLNNGGAQVLMTYSPVLVQPGGNAEIIQYVRTNWSVGSYTDPYTVILDAPRAVHYAPGAQNTGPQAFNVRTWIDNQYATIDREVPLVNVKVTITLPAGLSLQSGSLVQQVGTIAPNAIIPVDWTVVSDGETFGDLPVSVTIEPTPGPAKTITTTVRVAAKPTMTLPAGPNLVTFPYQFQDNSLDHIFDLTAGVDYVAYNWDADLRAYTPTTNVQRGVGVWMIPNATIDSFDLQGADVPQDTNEGGLFVNLKPGWNMIGNPYNYGVSIYQLVGVAEDNPSNSQTWLELVQSNVISSSLTYFEPNPSVPGGGTYKVQSGNVLMEPHRGYWVFVRSPKVVRLVWPALFQETLPGITTRSVERFAQTDREWRLQLSARSTTGFDSDNFVGVVTDRNRAKQLDVPKAPMAPGQQLELAVLDEFNGEQTRMAQSINDRQGRHEWKVNVKSEQAGEITVTWPNLPSLPRNLRAKITDDATGEKRDLRAASGYTFRMDQPGVRSFTLSIEPSGNSRPVIGNVLVQPSGRESNSPVVINYSLSADALVTVRILSATGKEVFTITRGRSDSAGENSATWTLKDNANRAVAPGTYKVEILAETPNGERVRKIVPINVIR